MTTIAWCCRLADCHGWKVMLLVLLLLLLLTVS